MCKVYNSVGSLTAIKSHLNRYNISEFKSLNEVISFQKSYQTLRSQIISNSEFEIEEEKKQILSSNQQLYGSIESTKEAVKNELLTQIQYLKSQLETTSSLESKSLLGKISKYFRISLLKRKIHNSELSLSSKVLRSVDQSMKTYLENERRFNYIMSNFQAATLEHCSTQLRNLEIKKAIIDEITPSIYGAIGEQKVVKELEKLSDEFVLINDFCLSFNPPIYNHSENDNIKSIQVDHLLIAPSGVFLIETKNWSEKSMNSLVMRSPVSQLKRTNFALFNVLNKKTEGLGLDQHHWGKKKIALKNILVFINQKPLEEFQFVKVLTLNQLLEYIKYFPPVYTRRETENIANELIGITKK